MDDEHDHRQHLDPTALSLADAARLFTKLGGQTITEAMLRDDVDAGAPTNADGTLHLVHYGAWLLRELGSGD